MTSPSTRLLLDTLARLHLAADAMGISASDIVLDDMSHEVQAECATRAAEDFRSWVNDERAKKFPAKLNARAHQIFTGRPHHLSRN